MPIFISYSHKDVDFVDLLAVQLVRHKVHVWVDRWELSVGDSLLARIQEAITGASALLVILTKASVQSEWCRKELNAGLLRELEEQRVVVLPVLVEECDIPLFLRDKLYADFRTSFDAGLKTILEAIAKVTNQNQSRIDAPGWHTDWAMDWQREDDMFSVRLTLVEQADDQPYSVLSTVDIICTEDATKRYDGLNEIGEGEKGRREIVGALDAAIRDGMDLSVVLEDQFERVFFSRIANEETGSEYYVRVATRRMGEDTGRDLVVHLGDQVRRIYSHMNELAAE